MTIYHSKKFVIPVYTGICKRGSRVGRSLFCSGKKVVGAMMRTADTDDFRSNLHAGGKAKRVTLTKEEKSIAINSANVLGLTVAGVDLIRTETGSKVLEVNSSPGLEGLEKTSKKNVAEKIIEHIENNVSSTVRQRRKIK